ncbi:hypothetical protein SAMN04489761_2475 [Tenacibaculum sp. MAR_2009_124]|nr:hypothetical protein SAMN04489761_2475 [Tenacibaculum sp. MAR_2009_124]
MTPDVSNFNQLLKFSRSGSKEGNYLTDSYLAQNLLISNNSLFRLPKEDFQYKINELIIEQKEISLLSF